MAEATKLNIPRGLLEEAVKDKDNESLLYLSVMIKKGRGDSRLEQVSIQKIRALCGFSVEKAKKILMLAKESNLFEYNSYTNCLVAKSFNGLGYIKHVETKHGRSVPGIKRIQYLFQCNSFREFHKWICDNLFYDILIDDARKRNKMRRDKSNKSLVDKSFVDRPGCVRTYGQIAEETGMTRDEIRNTVERLEKIGAISVIRQKPHEAEHDDGSVHQFKGSRSLVEYVQPANTYILRNMGELSRHKFVLLDNEWKSSTAKSNTSEGKTDTSDAGGFMDEHEQVPVSGLINGHDEEYYKNFACAGYANIFNHKSYDF